MPDIAGPEQDVTPGQVAAPPQHSAASEHDATATQDPAAKLESAPKQDRSRATRLRLLETTVRCLAETRCFCEINVGTFPVQAVVTHGGLPFVRLLR